MPQPERLLKRVLRVVDAADTHASDCIQGPQPRTLPAGVAGLAQRQHRLTMFAPAAKAARAAHERFVVCFFASRATSR